MAYHYLQRLSKDTIIYGLSSVANKSASLLLAPIVTRYLGPEEFGIVSLIQLSASLFIIIAGLNLGSAVGYYFNATKNISERRSVLSTGYTFSLLLGLVCSLLLYLQSSNLAFLISSRGGYLEKSEEISEYLRLSALYVCFAPPLMSSQAIIRLLHKPIKYMSAELFCLAINGIFLVIFLVIADAGSPLYSCFNSCLGGRFLFINVFIRKEIDFRFNFDFNPLIVYAAPQIPAAIFSWFQHSRPFVSK